MASVPNHGSNHVIKKSPPQWCQKWDPFRIFQGVNTLISRQRKTLQIVVLLIVFLSVTACHKMDAERLIEVGTRLALTGDDLVKYICK